MKVIFFLFGLFITIFFNSCGQEEQVPDYVWEDEKFIEVLTEFQMAEAIVRLGYHRNSDSMYFNDSVFNAAFRKAGVNQVQFDSNYNYHLKNPEKMEEIYLKVITRLNTRMAEFEGKAPAAQADSL